MLAPHVDPWREIHAALCATPCYRPARVYEYEQGGAALVWHGAVVVRVWPRAAPGDTLNDVDLLCLASGGATRIACAGAHDLARVHDALLNCVACLCETRRVRALERSGGAPLGEK